MKISVRILFVFLVTLFSIFILTKPSFAQVQKPVNQVVNSYAAPNTNPDVPNNLHTWTQSVMLEVMSSMVCQLSGIDPTNPSAKCLGVDRQTGKLGFVQQGGGAIGIMGGLIASTLTPPIHTRDYIAYLSNNFGLVKPTYAANQTGFSSLSPLMGTWALFRNIVYLIFVLVFLVVGIAIMLRVKIDPRTVMTIQNQIPKIIIGLVLVTFSFAIAGLLIDVMWIAIYLFINVLSQADPSFGPAAAGKVTQSLNNTTLGFVNNAGLYNNGILGVTTGAAGSVAGIISSVFSGSGSVTQSGGSFLDFLTNPIGSVVGAVFSILLQIIGGVAAFLIILIAILWAMFKLWFALLNAYIFILVDIIFAPFWIVTGLLPGGQSMGFGGWLRDMLGNLSAFPATVAMFLLGKVLIDNFGTNASAQAFLPPLIGNPASQGVSVFGSLIALGIIFTTPHVVSITKAAFKAPKIDLGPIEESIGAGQAVVGGAIGGATGSLFKKDQYGNPIAPGSLWMSKHVTNPAAKLFLGMNYKNPQEISEDLEQHRENVTAKRENRPATIFADLRRKELQNRVGKADLDAADIAERQAAAKAKAESEAENNNGGGQTPPPTT